MNYQAQQILWILLYLALIATSIIVAAIFHRRAGAGKGLLLGGAGAFALTGFYQLVWGIYYLSLTSSRNYYDNPLDDLFTIASFLFTGLLPLAGIFLFGAAAAKAGDPNPAPKAWTPPAAPVSTYPGAGYQTPPPAPAVMYPPAPAAPAAPQPIPPVAPMPMSAPSAPTPDGGAPAPQG